MKNMHMYNIGQHFSSSFLHFFFFGICLSLWREKKGVSEQDGRTHRQTSQLFAHTNIFDHSSSSSSLPLSFSNDLKGKNKKNRWTCAVYIDANIYLLQLASDQLYMQTISGGKIVRWREHAAMSREEEEENDINI